MTRKQYDNLKDGQMVKFQKSGKLNGKVVAAIRKYGERDIVYADPFDGQLCTTSYSALEII